MKRPTGLIATLGLLSISSFFVAQDLQSPLPPSSSDILGPDLIAWSQQQTPHPVPQPLPDPPQQQPEKQPSTANQDGQQPALRTFAGTIVKDSNNKKYVLKVSGDNVYQIDDQQKASQYEGREVKLVGTLDEKSGTIRVTSIELIF